MKGIFILLQDGVSLAFLFARGKWLHAALTILYGVVYFLTLKVIYA